MKEIWKDIKSHPNYQVSNLGKVKNKDTGRVLKPVYMQNGTVCVRLCSKNIKKKDKFHYISSLVARAFIGRRPKGEIVIHLNGKPDDNRLSNLKYGTRRFLHDNHRKQNNKSISSRLLTGDKVYAIKKLLCKGKSPLDIAKQYKVKPSTIVDIRSNRRWNWVKWPKMKKNFYYKSPYKKGEDAAHSKFTNSQVREIKKKLKRGIKGRILADKFNVDTGLISRIKHKKAWTHIK